MGWKSTKKISREEAQQLIMERCFGSSDRELESILESIGFGDDAFLPHYGYQLKIEL